MTPGPAGYAFYLLVCVPDVLRASLTLVAVG